ncbi:MAG: hypothetical protein IBX48_09375 [Thiomicrospira sp.]|uniref:hypothetical protein n=1 Tax=Thiomicrospira sp. TaxID=935 RepID=UPI001A0A6852|nr:hypothetical protein [Thiomicrospira sp.]MBE0494535.1 hypothetical protein [Thiomicrospira sp.]
MAEPDKTIDPNDLDSIDSLLDEAEFEQRPTGDNAPDEEEDLLAALSDEPEQESFGQNADDTSLDADDELDRMFETPLNERAVEPELTRPDPAIRTGDAEGYSARRDFQTEDDDFLARRASKNNGNELTVAEMDSLKSMIIGFGSALIVLALIGIGIATWGALSTGGNDADTVKMIEEIRGEAEVGRIASQSNENILRDLNRKLDALSFQIEQANGDIVALSQGKQPAITNAPGLPINLAQPQEADVPVETPQQVKDTRASAGLNVDMSKFEEKLDTVNRNVTVAQRRVVEINNRVKSLQQQYGSIVETIKLVERNMLEKELKAKAAEQEAANSEEAEKEQVNTQPVTTQQPDGYRYRAPDGGLGYDTGNMNSYP